MQKHGQASPGDALALTFAQAAEVEERDEEDVVGGYGINDSDGCECGRCAS
jgi:hypothetical protein